MKESIVIRNLGPLREIQIDDLKPLTILIGESASGKSTLLKCLSLFRYLYKLINIRSYLKLANISKSPFNIHMSTLLKSSGLLDMVGSDSEIIYSVEGVNRSYSLVYSNKKLKGVNNLIVDREDLLFSKVSFISENRTLIPTVAARPSSVKLGGMGFYFNQTFEDFIAASDSVNELELSYLGFKFDVKEINKQKKYSITPLSSKGHKAIELLNASSGVQTSTPLMVIAQYFATKYSFKDAFRRSVLDYLYDTDRLKDFKSDIELGDLDKWVHIHIEEPELSLFPTAQCQLVDDLVRVCLNQKMGDRDLTLMVATHSPYIINQLNLLLRRHRVGKRDKAFIDGDKLAVYKMVDGGIVSLLARDAQSQEIVVNTIDLSEPISDIYEEYQSIL